MEHHDPRLSQAYRDAAHPEPSPALDARILDAARQAVAKPAARRRPAWFAWAVPFSTAAVLVLGVTLLLEMQRRAPEVLESPTAIPPAIRLDIPESSPVPPPEPAAPQPEMDSSPRKAHQDAAPPPKARTPRAAPHESGTTVAPAEQTATEAAPQPFPAQQSAMSAPPPPPPVMAKPETREAPRPADSAAPEMARSAGAAANMADHSAEAMGAPPPPPAMAPARARAPAVGAAMEKRMAAEPVVETPERMVETIRRLMREGRLDEARKELEKLRRAYPGYAMPEDLRGL